MTANRFKFVSPGIKINEIDRSVLTAGAAGIGPVVVGRFLKGPGMVPRSLGFNQLASVFGSPSVGNITSDSPDIWRTGDLQSPTYAAFAVDLWSRFSAAPVTAIRLLGTQHPSGDGTDPSKAGWKANNGAWGIFVAPSGSNTSVTGALAAVLYLKSGTAELSGSDLTGAGVSGSNVFVKSVDDNYTFKLLIKNSTGAVVLNKSVSLGRADSVSVNNTRNNNIRKVLNTNPVLTNTSITPNALQTTYWLGETFGTFLETVVTASSKGNVIATIAPLATGSGASKIDMGNHLGLQAQPAKTGWVIGQDLTSETGSFSPTSMPKLFRFSTLGGEKGDSSGEWEQKNIMVCIENITPPRNIYEKYGEFDVTVRPLNNPDPTQQPLETFRVNLNPSSPRYIARVIGDKYRIWNNTQKKHKLIGSFANLSNFIRVEVHPLLEQGALDPELVPFGFYGPPQFTSAVVEHNVAVSNALLSGAINSDSDLDIQLKYPTIPLVVTASNSELFGLQSLIPSLQIANHDVTDLLRNKPTGVDSYESNGILTVDSVLFTLDDISGSTSTISKAMWVSGSRASGVSITAVSASDTGSTGGYKSVLSLGFDSFAMPLFGGTDGFRIDEKDPFRNSFMENVTADTDPEGKSNYAVYTLLRALESVADPETLNMNILTVPGVTVPIITDKVIEVCENRADSLAIIDLPGGYTPSAESDKTESERVGSVFSTINQVKLRNFNSSYACAYYPWVKLATNNNEVWVPPSVVALGTMAYSEERSAVWFAPAGFNRGGLAQFGVTQVVEQLRAAERDDLYEVNINPIAFFPSEGIVVFGQKTLQATRSALDRINVRRMVLFLKKQISLISSSILFDQNIKTTWQRFLNKVNPLLQSVKAGGGLADFLVVLDETTTTPDLIDRNTMYAKIFIKPAYAIEFIAIDFVITNTGASFNDI